ncbi:MAG: CSN-associated deubiquitinating enzyme Ubp12 [Trizodia sp. TS-e1964]|nr:MAG: CSN-associated deubiquitinating enzyme Ubp12 [Trizodia sp. TS-e1964]
MDPSSSTLSSPSTACARLTLEGEKDSEMSGVESAKTPSLSPREGPGSERSSSPAVKRTASERDDGDEEAQQEDVNMLNVPLVHRILHKQTASGLENTPVAISGGKSASATASENTLGSTPGSNTSTMITDITNSSNLSLNSRTDMLSIDEQIERVQSITEASPARDGDRGYVISQKWLSRVMARSSLSKKDDKLDKDAIEGDIGPVDNTLLIDPNTTSTLLDHNNLPFYPMRRGLRIGEDYEVIPPQAWDLILKWYGLAATSPPLVRYAHNTNPEGSIENVQYEIYPPIFTILKLRNDSVAGSTHQSMKEAKHKAVKALSSSHGDLNHFLSLIKSKVGLETDADVRVWRVLEEESTGTTALAPAASRSVSPAPKTSVRELEKRLILEHDVFFSFQDGSQREILDLAHLHGARNTTLATAGLGGDNTLIIEERIGGIGGGEWISDSVKKVAVQNGVSLANGSSKGNLKSTSGRSTPSGIMTRGREARGGRILGACGLSNLGNTCYMNSALQCVRSVEELTRYFLADKHVDDLNPENPLAYNGDIASAYATLLHTMYAEHAPASTAPRQFKNTIGRHGPSFSGYGQQDSQEFLGFLLDGLQEDLNRIKQKPYMEKPDSTDDMVNDPNALRALADKCWQIYKARNDSVITDLFAGSYQSTVVCPVCDKVSITFDPFNNLTLQLPIENNWSKQVFFFPKDGPPINVSVDMDKNGTMRDLKEFVGGRVGVDPSLLHAAEIYKARLFKVFDDNNIASESIQQNDNVAIYELEDLPTNWPAPKKKKPKSSKPLLSYPYGNSDEEDDVPDWDSPLNEKMLVPIFHRHPKEGNISRYSGGSLVRLVFGIPLYVVITREEARDYDTILRKVLARVATLTHVDIFKEFESPAQSPVNSSEDADMCASAEDDGMSSADSGINAHSVEGEDGLVDISMGDVKDAPSNFEEPTSSTTKGVKRNIKSKILEPGSFIDPALRTMFEMKYFASPTEIIPTGWQSLNSEGNDYLTLASRIRVPPSPPLQADDSQEDQFNPHRRGSSSASDDDPDLIAPNKASSSISQDSGTDNDTEYLPPYAETSGRKSNSKAAANKNRWTTHKTRNTYSRKEKNRLKYMANDSDDGAPDDGPLIRLGEGIILDWSLAAYIKLFRGNGIYDPTGGCPTWEDIPMLPDPALDAQRLARTSRRKEGISLKDCLDEFAKEEILSENDAWYCPRCKEHRRASKKFELWKIPDILVVHLKRFSANRSFRDKIDLKVDFPIQGLDLTERVAMKEDGKEYIYDLFAVDNHYGGLGGGHYTAFAHNFVDSKWREYNDSSVQLRDPEDVVTAAAYLLFYRRRSQNALGGALFEQIVNNADIEREPHQELISTSTSTERPAGEGQHLDDSCLNGSSSVSAGAGAALHGVSGLRGGVLPMENDEEAPTYSRGVPIGEQRIDSMDIDEDEGVGVYKNDGARWSWSGISYKKTPEIDMGLDPVAENSYDVDNASTRALSSAGGSNCGDHNVDLGFDELGLAASFEDTPLEQSHSLLYGSPAGPMNFTDDAMDIKLPGLVEDDEQVTEVHVEEGEGLLKAD